MSGRRLTIVAVIAWAAFLRVSGLGWDGWTHQNPDERFLVMVEERLSIPSEPWSALDPERSTLVPENVGHSFYVYGGLPPVVIKGVAEVVGLSDYGGLLKVGRALTVVVDLVALLLVMALALRLGGEGAGLLAGLLYGSAPLLLQQARFATVDAWATTFVLAAAWAVLGRETTIRRLIVSAAAVGLAVACKPNMVIAGAIPGIAMILHLRERRRAGAPIARQGLLALAVLATVPLVVLKITDPGAFAQLGSLVPNPRRLASLAQLAGFFAGDGQYPPNLQWADRIPVLEPLANLLVWGTGPLLGLTLMAGVGWIGRRMLLGDRRWVPVLGWAVPTLVWQLSRFVVSVRHLEVFLPFGIVVAACWLARRRRLLRSAVVIGTVVWGLAWAAVAWSPHTRVDASRWLADRFPDGAVVTSEIWDDALPLPGHRVASVRNVPMEVFAPDTEEKREAMLAALDEADAVVLASQRGVGSICRVPDAYPLTAEYYHLLFSGALGFRLEAEFQRRVGVGTFSVSDLRAEESLSVYDHPPVWIFVKTSRYSSELARKLFARVPLPATTSWRTGDLEVRGTPPYMERWHESGRLPGRWLPGPLRMAAIVGLWIAAVELCGLLGVSLIRRLAPGLPDAGWGAARWVGMAAVGVGWLWLGWAGVPGWNGWVPTIALVIALPWGAREMRHRLREPGYWRMAFLVWGVFGLFLLLRAFHPEIYWGEKPMDAGLLASIWRADRLPPVDPWFAGSPLNYYFFGFLPYAFVGRAVGANVGVAFNLAVATIPALTAGAAAAIGWLLSRRWSGAVTAAVLVQLAGTAAIFARPSLLLHPSFSEFWASSRVIADTINEFPVWTAVFSDLHAHFMGFAGFLVAVLLISILALGEARWRHAGFVIGGVVAAEAMTNSWEVPALVLLLLVAVSTLARRTTRLLVLGRAGVAAVVASLPYWLSARAAAAAVGASHAPAPGLLEMAELFGPLAVLVVASLVATLLIPDTSRALAWTWVLVGVGVILVATPELVTVADRMNTVFKLHLQAHLLLGAAVGALLGRTVFGMAGWLGRLLRVVAAITIVVMVTTTAGIVMSFASLRRVPGPRPTLDGAAYLEILNPDQAAVLEAFSLLPYAAPVVEPIGSPYTDTLRVPMFTGLPVIVGWEYHLWQRRHAWSEIGLRREDENVLFYGTDGDLVAALLRRYRVGATCAWSSGAPAAARVEGWRPLVQRPGAVAYLAPRGGS